MINEAVEKVKLIQAKIKMVQDRQKSYSDERRKGLEFKVRESIYLKVSPNKGVVQFRTVGKLKLPYIEPFEILEKVVVLAYRFALPPNLSGVHNVFHVSMLKKYVCNEGHIIQNFTQLEIQHDTLYVEKSMKSLGREENGIEEENNTCPIAQSWCRRIYIKIEEDTRKGYPHLFVL